MNFSEKYRPKTLEEVVGQEEITSVLSEKTDISHMLFIGPPGTGKTTVAHILSKKFDIPIEELNASDDRGIGVVRDKIKRLSSTTNRKIILLDESDSLTREAQDALRRIIEKSPSVFILTGNYPHKIIKPIKSRCSIYEFKPIDEKMILRKLIDICKKEGISIENNDQTKEGLKTLVSKSNGDMRKAINMLETVVTKGKITSANVLSLMHPNHASEALKAALNGDLEGAQRLLENDFKNNSYDVDDMIRSLYDSISTIPTNEFRAKLYYKLSLTANACRESSQPILPLIHLVGFIAYAWILPHMPQKCPLSGEDIHEE